MNTECISKIKEIVSLNKREDGWTEMSIIGLKLIKNEIDIKDYGFSRLKPFFESLSEHFVIDSDEHSSLPLVKCRGQET
ncbi:MAG: OST-HTH/LOTUS domain-containing protein, partial [Bacteroidales bacterium]|nr:OST-HTH/LOTUS domain-containing protein [Candidatus Equimonas enterica]